MGTQPHQPGRLNIVNRNKYKTFQNSPIIPFKTDRRLKAVKLERICHDEVYADLKAKGLQIDITNPEILVNGKRPIDGIFSPLFGADTTQDIPIYSCDCRKLTGGTNLGRICPECGKYRHAHGDQYDCTSQKNQCQQMRGLQMGTCHACQITC